MAVSEEVDVVQLESRLGGVVPTAYRSLLAGESPTALKARGFDAKTLLVLSLELRSHEHIECEGRLFLNGDGCGNYLQRS